MCWGSGGRRSARDEPRRRGRPLQTFLSVSGPLQGSLQARRERESSSYRGVREEVSSPLFSFQMLQMLRSSRRLSWRRILGEQTRF